MSLSPLVAALCKKPRVSNNLIKMAGCPEDNLKPKGKTALERFIDSRKGPSQRKKERKQSEKQPVAASVQRKTATERTGPRNIRMEKEANRLHILRAFSEIEKVGIGKRQLNRILDAVAAMEGKVLPEGMERTKRTVRNLSFRARDVDRKRILDEMVENPERFYELEAFDPRKIVGNVVANVPKRRREAIEDIVSRAKELPKEERRAFIQKEIKSPFNPYFDDVRKMPSYDPRKVEKITPIRELAPSEAHKTQGVQQGVLWRAITPKTHTTIAPEDPIWGSPLPGVSAGYAQGDVKSKLKAFDIADIPEEHLSLPSKHVAMDTRGLSSEEIGKLPRYRGSGTSSVGSNPYYEQTVTSKHLGDPIAEYRALDPEVGLWQRVRGRRRLTEGGEPLPDIEEAVPIAVPAKKPTLKRIKRALPTQGFQATPPVIRKRKAIRKPSKMSEDVESVQDIAIGAPPTREDIINEAVAPSTLSVAEQPVSSPGTGSKKWLLPAVVGGSALPIGIGTGIYATRGKDQELKKEGQQLPLLPRRTVASSDSLEERHIDNWENWPQEAKDSYAKRIKAKNEKNRRLAEVARDRGATGLPGFNRWKERHFEKSAHDLVSDSMTKESNDVEVTMTELEKLGHMIAARAFFEELENLDKQAMLGGISELHKEAFWRSALMKGKGLISDIGLGAQRLSKARGGEGLAKGVEDLGQVWQKGKESGGLLGGAGAFLKTRRGKALTAAGLGTAGLLGGTGYLAGRSSGSPSQNVYVR